MDQVKYVVVTLPNKSTWKIPFEVVADHFSCNLACTGDIDLVEAIKQVQKSPDLVVANWVRNMRWDECIGTGTLIRSGNRPAWTTPGREELGVVVMTESEIDRFLTQKTSQV